MSETSAFEMAVEPSKKIDREKVQGRIDGLCEKYKLVGAIGNGSQVAEETSRIMEQYQIPEEFTDDDINMALIVGSAQKLVEIPNELYRQRVSGFIECLVEPIAASGTTKIRETWGSEHTGQLEDRKSVLEYASEHIDLQASSGFVEKFRPNLDRCVVIWSEQGYNLEVQVAVLDVSSVELKKMCGGAAFIMTPEDDEMTTKDGVKTVSVVIPKQMAEKNGDLIAHELFHIEDKFDMVRRGFGGRILESLDELFTEYSVGNYGLGDDREERCLAYLGLKEFWCKLQATTGLDSSLLGDRQAFIETVIGNFGFEGFVDFAMMNAQSSGPATHYETLYKYSERAVLAMLVSRAKVDLRKGSEVDTDAVVSIKQSISEIDAWTKPSPQQFSPRYRYFFDLLPNVHSKGKVYVNDGVGGQNTLINGESCSAVVDYATAIALLELKQQGEIQDYATLIEELPEMIAGTGWHRAKPDYRIEEDLQKEAVRFPDLSEAEKTKELIRPLFISLVHDFKGIDFLFGLGNQATRQAVMVNFTRELDNLATYVETLGEEAMSWFVRGIYGYNPPWELREFAHQHIGSQHPEYSPLLDKARLDFNQKKARNLSL